MAPTKQSLRPLQLKLSPKVQLPKAQLPKVQLPKVQLRDLKLSKSTANVGFIATSNGKGQRQRSIILGPLYATEVCPSLGPGTPGTIDIGVIANHFHHWAVWTNGTKFDIDAFLTQKSSDFGTITTTSDYVSRLDVERIVVAINSQWKWNTGPDALTTVSLPIVHDLWSLHTFPFTKEANIDLQEEGLERVYKKLGCFWSEMVLE